MDKSSGPTVQEFLGEFWKSFRKYLLIYTGMVSVGLGVIFYLEEIPRPEQDAGFSDLLTLVFTFGTLLLFMVYCIAWAGAMRRCAVEAKDVVPTTATGALIFAVLAFFIMMAALDFLPLAAILPALAVFLVSWCFITWSWFTLGLGGPFWW